MKNMFLSVMVISVLIAAGIGGTLADFSDYEFSEDNYFSTGALDLKVSDYLGIEYQGDSVPAFFQYSDAWPCSDKSFYIDLENWGQGSQFIPWAYIHFKNLECGWTWPKQLYRMVLCDPDTKECIDEMTPDEWDELTDAEQEAALEAGWKPVNEPEYVAECGGIAGEDEDGNPVEVPGIGCYGDCCELAEHIGVMIWVAGPWPHEEKPEYNDPDIEWTQVFNDKLDELDCWEFELGQIPNCSGIWVHIAFHLQDYDEEDAYADGLIPETYFDEDYPEAKWDHWPTNAMQKDYVEFDIGFELLQNRVPQP
jgi:predicted ribosomally synthesized peptide with SipW-like signal peptide